MINAKRRRTLALSVLYIFLQVEPKALRERVDSELHSAVVTTVLLRRKTLTNIMTDLCTPEIDLTFTDRERSEVDISSKAANDAIVRCSLPHYDAIRQMFLHFLLRSPHITQCLFPYSICSTCFIVLFIKFWLRVRQRD